MGTNFKTAILVLAAGASSRMNEIKQVLPYKDSTLLGNALKMAKMSKSAQVFCVLGANKEEIQQKVDFLDIEIIENKEWSAGLGKSIAVGVATIDKNRKYDSVLVMLGDQPFITSRYLDQLISKFNENQSQIIATNYSCRPGVPAVFPRQKFSELIKLSGDSGAKLILKNQANIIKLDAENTFDIDSPEDYKKISR